MARRIEDDDDGHWLFKFIRGALAAVVVCGAALVVLSLYVLPPAKPPAEAPVAATGPTVIDGIEVSKAPAQVTPEAVQEAPQPAAQPGTEATATGATPPAADDGAGPSFPDGPALSVNAVPFTPPADMPLVAVVIDDTAADPFLHEALFALQVPLTIGVVAGNGGDREVAARAREAGFEVVAELPVANPGEGGGVALEPGMTAEAAKARIEALVGRLPGALAISRPMAARGLPEPDTLKGLAEVLNPHGFAYLDQGVNEGENSLLGLMGLGFTVAVSRYEIPAGMAAGDMVAVFDKAAAAAGPAGGAVIVAVPSPDLIQALQLWGGEGSVSAGALAPLSAVIARQGS